MLVNYPVKWITMTKLLSVHAENPDPAAIAEAAESIRNGGLGAFPTETVYGLGANALDVNAVGRIFTAKGRPAADPRGPIEYPGMLTLVDKQGAHAPGYAFANDALKGSPWQAKTAPSKST